MQPCGSIKAVSFWSSHKVYENKLKVGGCDILNIVEAESKDMDVVRELFREYQAWLDVDVCFQGFEEELASLPGRYAAPEGVIFLVFDEKQNNPIACSAIRPRIDQTDDKQNNKNNDAELKRLFVHEDYRGGGIGKDLFFASMSAAKEMGYASVVLETLPIMKKAKSLYQRYGFESIPAYFDNADESVEFYRYQFPEDEKRGE